MKLVRLYLTILLLASVSCQHKKLCYEEILTYDVSVQFDWRQSPEAEPGSMVVIFFPENGKRNIRYDLPGKNGMIIPLPKGNYNALCFNGDSQNLVINNPDSFEEFTIETPPSDLLDYMTDMSKTLSSPPRANGTESESVRKSPDMLWSDSVVQIEVGQGKVNRFAFTPQQSFSRFHVTVKNISNLKYDTKLSGSLSSLGGAYRIIDRKICGPLVTVPFGVRIGEQSVAVSEFLSFGYIPEYQNKHMLTIYAVLSDGQAFMYSFDVTEQVMNAPDPKEVDIVIESLTLPKPITNGGGFKPEVQGWNNNEIGIPM